MFALTIVENGHRRAVPRAAFLNTLARMSSALSKARSQRREEQAAKAVIVRSPFWVGSRMS